MTVPQPLKVTGDLYYFESRTVSPFAVSGVYLIVRDEVALIEAGTSISAPHLLQAIKDLGIDLERVTTLIPTHVHLDHAGGAGWLVEKLPHLKVWVHRRGLQHLADPARICFSQFGWRDDPEWIFFEISRQLDFYARLVKTGLGQGLDVEGILVRIKNSLESQGLKNPEESGEMLLSLVLGYKMYFERQ